MIKRISREEAHATLVMFADLLSTYNSPSDKFHKSIELFDICVETAKVTQQAAKLNEQVDDLIIHFRENFPVPDLDDPVMAAHLSTLVAAWKSDDLLVAMVDTPRNVHEAMWPLIVMRTMLQTYNLQISRRHLKEFGWFTVTYQHLLY